MQSGVCCIRDPRGDCISREWLKQRSPEVKSGLVKGAASLGRKAGQHRSEILHRPGERCRPEAGPVCESRAKDWGLRADGGHAAKKQTVCPARELVVSH